MSSAQRDRARSVSQTVAPCWPTRRGPLGTGDATALPDDVGTDCLILPARWRQPRHGLVAISGSATRIARRTFGGLVTSLVSWPTRASSRSCHRFRPPAPPRGPCTLHGVDGRIGEPDRGDVDVAHVGGFQGTWGDHLACHRGWTLLRSSRRGPGGRVEISDHRAVLCGPGRGPVGAIRRPGGLIGSEGGGVGAACSAWVAHRAGDGDWQLTSVTGLTTLVLAATLYPYGWTPGRPAPG